ncbi:MAG: methyltransferase domain-containing protein [Kineosporiaceae bacterium]
MGRHERVAELAALEAAARTGLRPPALVGGGSPAAPQRSAVEVADLGCGQGRTVRALLGRAEVADVAVRVHAVDTGSDLDDDLLHDPRVRSVLADLDRPLPFEDASLDRIVCLNVAEHLADPVALLVECGRVLRPGGRMVLAHSDWDTCLFTSDDDALTRRLVDRFVALVPQWAQRSDGFMGRKLLHLAADSPLVLEEVQTWADCHRRFAPDTVAWKVVAGMLAAAADDAELAPLARDWAAGLPELAQAGRFLFTVTDVAVVLRRPDEA